MIILAFSCIDFETIIRFEEIKTSSIFGEKTLRFVKTRVAKPSDEQIDGTLETKKVQTCFMDSYIYKKLNATSKWLWPQCANYSLL